MMKASGLTAIRNVLRPRRGIGTFAPFLVPIMLSLASNIAAAQNDQSSLTLADTSSPRATLKTFIDYCNKFHRTTQADRYFDRRSPRHRPLVRGILDCLDTSELPDYARDDIASEAALA